MKESFEKILDRFGELHERYVNQYGVVGGNPMAFSVKECMEIVHEVAEEYNGGWIACSERLPENDCYCLITTSDMEIGIREYGYSKGFGWDGFERIIAWKPLPEPFKERD